MNEAWKWAWRISVLFVLLVIAENTKAVEMSAAFGSLLDEHPDWKVLSVRVNGDPVLTWYARVNIYSNKGSACGGGMYDGRRFFMGAGVCQGGTDPKYIETPWRYNVFGGWYVGKRRRWFISVDHESNCRSMFDNATGDRCLFVLPRGPRDKANKGVTFLKGGFKFNTGGK